MVDPWTRMMRAQSDAMKLQAKGLDAMTRAADAAATTARATKAMADLNGQMLKATQDWIRLWTPRR